jgi:hypothetical protein
MKAKTKIEGKGKQMMQKTNYFSFDNVLEHIQLNQYDKQDTKLYNHSFFF